MTAPAPRPSGPPRIALDTNVCLDLFVFRDPVVATLREALDSGAVAGVTDDACREEWLRVLAYPALRLDEAEQARHAHAYDTALRCIAMAPVPHPLPRCADPDDQKFLELAARCEAHWLLSRDDALLKLARRMQREEWFAILSPAQWIAQWASRTA
ncbi:PIN domain-containing protein [Lysobacter sp. LF1]|uniref:PIN domain-containing protein n=1 Tax=Lysobacter stagni TaxID=3045172 RepID=A0ABT6XK85_9GAMM|nr:PIN domain-containing protein [Lysobacter sp. LF1]MDI9240576.1 PIN domain-containing protein [Lysobacter sp. LF1]